MRQWTTAIVVCLAAAVCMAEEKRDESKPAEKTAEAGSKTSEAKPMTVETATSPLDFTVKDMDGKDVALTQFKGEVVMIVNVASKCGYTRQYKDLQAIYDKYKDKGFRIVAFPANDFGGQEPGTNAEIKQFCEREFGVKFDVMSKITVSGKERAPIYQFLTSKEKAGELGGDIQWNFTKFLVGRDGKLISRFEPRVSPSSAEATGAIEKALAAPKPEAKAEPAKSGKD